MEDLKYKKYMRITNWHSVKNRFKNLPVEYRKEAKPVKCIETGIIYPSVTRASRAVMCRPSTMSAHLNGVTNSCRGLHFMFVTKESK